jgi:hypothetical protein
MAYGERDDASRREEARLRFEGFGRFVSSAAPEHLDIEAERPPCINALRHQVMEGNTCIIYM